MSDPSKSFTILAFGPGAWPDGWVWGSPRYHLHGLAERGARVVYIEPPQGRWRQRALRSAARRSQAGPRGHQGPPIHSAPDRGRLRAFWPGLPLWVYSPKTPWFFHPRIPLPAAALRRWNVWALRRLAQEVRAALALAGFRDFERPDLLWLGAYSHAPLLNIIPHEYSACLIYDDLPRSPAWGRGGARIVAQLETELIRNVNLAAFTSMPLYESRREQCRKALLLENAVSEQFFDEQLPISPPTASGRTDSLLNRISLLPRPRIGYVGALNLRMDLDILGALIAGAPRRDWSLVFAGPLDSLYCKGLRKLRSLPGAVFPGPVAPMEVPQLLRLFDVLILPHAINDFTRAMFPEKLPEYLATGRPIVSTPLPEVLRVIAGQPEGIIAIARSPGEFVEACAKMLEKTSMESTQIRMQAQSLTAARIALARRHTRAIRLDLLIRAIQEMRNSGNAS